MTVATLVAVATLAAGPTGTWDDYGTEAKYVKENETVPKPQPLDDGALSTAVLEAYDEYNDEQKQLVREWNQLEYRHHFAVQRQQRIAGRQAPPTSPAPAPTDTGGVDWYAIAECESGMDPNAYNPAGPYMGYLQFSQETWSAYGGSGSPLGKSLSEHIAVASGMSLSHWPNCGVHG